MGSTIITIAYLLPRARPHSATSAVGAPTAPLRRNPVQLQSVSRVRKQTDDIR